MKYLEKHQSVERKGEGVLIWIFFSNKTDQSRLKVPVWRQIKASKMNGMYIL